MKKLLFTLMAIALSYTAVAAPVQLAAVEDAGEVAYSQNIEAEALLCAEFEGEGTKTSPYIISTAEQLLGISSVVNNAKGAEYFFSLDADIDLENAEWTPIGTSSNPFNGAFYGNGHSVSNLKITQGRTDNGFFGYVKQADISKLSLQNVTLDYNYEGSTTTYAGLLAGRAYKESTDTNLQNKFSEISVTGRINISSKNSTSYTGGIFGYVNSKSGNYIIENCLSLVNINITSNNARKVYCGGVLAKLEDNVSKFTLSINNSYYSGKIDIKSSGDVICGGVAGDLFSAGSGWVSGWYGTLMDDSTEDGIVKTIADGDITINTTGDINVGYINGFKNSEISTNKCASLSTQTISATKNGSEFTKYTDSPTRIEPENLKTYATETLGFNQSIWNFNAPSGAPIIGNTDVFTITFNANGGENAPSEQSKIYGFDTVLSATVPTRAGYKFLGWATSENGNAEYAASATFSINANTTLYAVWQEIIGDLNLDNAVDGTDITLLADLLSGKTAPESITWLEKANVYKEQTDSDTDLAANLDIKDLIKLAQLASNN